MSGVWSWFRGLPKFARILAWVALFPVVAALAITRGKAKPEWRLVAGLAVLVLTGPFWLAAAFAGSSDSASTPSATPTVETPPEPEPEPVPEPESVEEVSEPEPVAPDVEEAPEESPSPAEPSPSVPEPGSSQARAPPATETSDGVLVSTLFAELTIAPEQPAGYDRSLFRHWITTNGCTTRNHVLIRDSNGTAVVSSTCVVTSGQWYSPFDAVWVDVPRSLDIDHFVPLAEAWRSGARNWDEPTRRAFANDLDDPRTLIAVTASSNRSKGDRDPANWLPTNTAYRCDYVGTWVAIKHRWELSIDSSEQAAIQRVLSGCGELRTSPSTAARPTTGPAPAPAPSPTPAPADQCVNINSAAIEDLLRIVHIGPARAEELVSKRPFSRVDDLTRITGIGPARIADIKAEGLACVG